MVKRKCTREIQVAVSDDDSDDEDDQKVYQTGTSIYFYSDVTRESILKLITCIRKAKQEVVRFSGHTSTPCIELYINSEGGDAYAGLSGMDHIRNSAIPIHTIADGFVASAATFLLLAGAKRFAMPHSTLLIHQLSSHFFGKYNELVDEMHNTRTIMTIIRKLYLSNTKMTEEQTKDLLSKELNLTATKSLKMGFVHEIIGS